MKTKMNLKNLVNGSFQTLIIVLIVLFSLPTMAQEDSKKEKQWDFTAAPYLLIPYMNGNVGIGPVEAGVDRVLKRFLAIWIWALCSILKLPAINGWPVLTCSI